MTPIIITLVITMMTSGQEYERYIPMDSIGECVSQAAVVLKDAANVRLDTVRVDKADATEIGAGCVIKIDPGQSS
jgi:hypothetical protein